MFWTIEVESLERGPQHGAWGESVGRNQASSARRTKGGFVPEATAFRPAVGFRRAVELTHLRGVRTIRTGRPADPIP